VAKRKFVATYYEADGKETFYSDTREEPLPEKKA